MNNDVAPLIVGQLFILYLGPLLGDPLFVGIHYSVIIMLVPKMQDRNGVHAYTLKADFCDLLLLNTPACTINPLKLLK